MELALAPRATASVPWTPAFAEIVDLPWLRARAAAWDELLAGATYTNPFFGRHVIEAHAATGLIRRDLRFLVVCQGDELRALVPVEPGGARLALRRAGGVWLSRIINVNATPLLARGDLERTVATLLDAMAQASPVALWRWPALSLRSEAGEALVAGIRHRGWPIEVLSSFERAVLNRREDYESYARNHLSAHRRKGLRRQRRRLAELGPLEHRSFAAGEGLRRAIEMFLDLEARGWKGARRTALASRPETRRLAEDLFQPAEGPVRARADVLSLDERPVAASLALLCGGTGFMLKTAYDERLAPWGPGLLLEDAIVRAFHETGFADRLDSAGVAGGVLDDLYADRETIGELVFAATPSVTARALRMLAAQERRSARLLRELKRLYLRDAG
jgi:CelD/BcsL family acetyltransferase involved in cellulose biosynthesis